MEAGTVQRCCYGQVQFLPDKHLTPRCHLQVQLRLLLGTWAFMGCASAIWGILFRGSTVQLNIAKQLVLKPHTRQTLDSSLESNTVSEHLAFLCFYRLLTQDSPNFAHSIMTWGVCGESCSSFSSRPTHRHGVWCVDWYSVPKVNGCLLSDFAKQACSILFFTFRYCMIYQSIHITHKNSIITYNYIHMQNYDGTDWGEKNALWNLFKRLWLHKGPIMEGPGISERLPFLTLGRISWITTLSLLHYFLVVQKA